MKKITSIMLLMITLFLSESINCKETNKEKSIDIVNPSTTPLVENIAEGFYVQAITSTDEKKIKRIKKSLVKNFPKGKIDYFKDNKSFKLLIGKYKNRKEAEKIKRQLIKTYPKYSDAFINEINYRKIWGHKIREHLKSCWGDTSHLKGDGRASVSLKISKNLYITSKTFNSIRGSKEFFLSINEAIKKCSTKRLPQPKNQKDFDENIHITFQIKF